MNREQNQSLIPYRNNLNGVSRQRYLEKIHSLNGLDPYEHIEWTNDLNELPEVTLPDVFGYLVCGVLHSQRLNETPLKLWVVISVLGKWILHNAPAWLALQSCTHVGSLLLKIEAAVRIRGPKL
ncbi:hypothetical protein CHARACLAT_010353 [Characodon lateralis]|uniref:Uncharacterized protein n=1 Tax=Characodon lateralis TaxID=208331 RepID=A0ABU7DPZ1_9TELE|nr:hypothetical protein [Characodon lateralis]